MKDKETYLRNFDKAFQEDAYASRLNQDLSRNKPQAISVADSQLASQNDTIGNGFFGHMKDAADAGFFGSLAGTARFGAEFSPFGGEWLNSVADSLDERVRQNTPIDALTGSDYFAAAVGNALGSGAAGMLEGAVLLGAGSALGTAMVPAGTAVGVYRAMRTTPVLGKLVKATRQMWKSNFGKMQLAEVAGSPIEATAEAGNLITEMRNEGYSDDEIRSAALQSAKYNTGWLLVANMVGGKINNAIGSEGVKAGIKGAAKAAIKGAATEGVGEAVQEYGQSYAHDAAKGVEFNQEEAEEAALQALVGSAFLGGVGNVAKPYINKSATKEKAKPQETAKEEASGDESSNQPVAELPEGMQEARNIIIDHRETLDEDDAEYGRLTEVLENGNDEEIMDVANAIRGVEQQDKMIPRQQEEVVSVEEETIEEPSSDENVVTGEVVETTNLEAPSEEVVSEKEEAKSEEPPASNKKAEAEIKDEDLPPTSFDAMEGLTTEKPENKSKFQEAVEETKSIKQQIRNQEIPTEAKDDLDEDGFHKKIGDYEASEVVKNGKKLRLYTHKDNKDSKILHYNENGTYTVDTVATDENGKETSVYESFADLKGAENYIKTGKVPKGHKLKTYKVSVRDSKGKIKVWTVGGTSKTQIDKELKNAHYRVRVIAEPDKFDAAVEAFGNKVEAYRERRRKKKEEANSNLKPNLTVIAPVANEPFERLTPAQRKARVKIMNDLVALLRQTGIKVFGSPLELANAAKKGMKSATSGEVILENNRVYIVKKDGSRFEINGLADSNTDTIYFNALNPNIDIPIHEYTHIWTKILYKTKPELWKKGVELLKQTPKWEEIKNHGGYRFSNEDAIADEVLAWLVGENGAKLIEQLEATEGKKTLASKLKAWLKEFWSELKSFFELHGDEHVKELTLEEFINMPLKDLISGKKIKEIKDRAEITSSDNSIFAKRAGNGSDDVLERKLENFLKYANSTVKSVLASIRVKNRIIEIAKANPTLLQRDEGDEHYYYARYVDKNKGKEPVTKPISASVFKALKEITGAEVKPYEEKSEAVKEGMTPQEAILADTNIKEFIKEYIASHPKYSNREEAMESALLNVDEKTGKTFAELIREAAVKDLPEAGKENEMEAFYDIDEELFDFNSADIAGEQYYNYLIDKYQTKLTGSSPMLVPVSKNQTQNKKVRELEKRLKAGESRLSIWKETGWYKAKDGHWKTNISDDFDAIDFGDIANPQGKLKAGEAALVKEIYNNAELFRELPYLANVEVVFDSDTNNLELVGKNGFADSPNNQIRINTNNVGSERAKVTLLHELQHIIQEREDWARGTGTSKKSIMSSLSRTLKRYLNEVEAKVGIDAREYVFSYVTWKLADTNAIETNASKTEIRDAKKEVNNAKKDFLANSTKVNQQYVDDVISKVEELIDGFGEIYNNPSSNTAAYDVYNYALGEEEARLVAREASIMLDDHDANLGEELINLLDSMPEEDAVNLTNYLWEYRDDNAMSAEEFKNELKMFGVDSYNAFFDKLNKAHDKEMLKKALGFLNFVMGNDFMSLVFLGKTKKAFSDVSFHLSKVDNADSVESRLRKAVTTVKPTSIKEDIEKAGGKQSWLAKQWRKFYRAWVDKNVDIKDFDEILSNALGRALTAGESIYNKVQMAMSKASGVAHGLIEGDEKHLKAINGEMKRKPMKYIKATLANVLDIVNAEKMNKLAPNYLAKFGEGYTWVEAFGTYLGWRRLAEMARLHREAFAEEHADWVARKKAYEAWASSGRIGDNPQVAAYKEWEAYQKAKKDAKRRWERNGKIGPDPSEAIKAEWLATHKDEEAPKKYVGKEPVFEEYKMPEGLTEKDVLKAISEAPAPFAEAANLYYKLNDNILSIMEDAGLISAELHELLNTKYKDYCPMIRDFSDTAAVDTFVESITVGGKGVANVSSMLKKIRAEGSERTIINPLESTLQTIAAVTNRAERNKAGQHLVRMMVSAPELKGQIRKLEQPKHGTIQADPKNCIFTVMFNGKKVAYQSDPEYYQAIVGYNLPTSSLLLRIPQTVASTLRTGATMSPSFIVRNIFRDTITAGIASKNGFIPIIDTIRGAKALWNDPDFRAKFEAAGIVNFNQYGSSESAYRNLTALGSGKNYTVYEPKEIIKGVLEAVFKGKGMEALKTAGISFEQLSSFAESATRAGEFKKALEAGKSMSEAAYDAKEVTIDFTRSGIVGQEFNRVIPFFNACIQGSDKMVRLFCENPMGTAMKVGMYIALPSIALWVLNQGEDWYEELDPSVKYTHWCLPNGVRVPKPQEYGILFGGSIEAMLDQASQKDPRAMKEWADAMLDVVTPSVLPTIILPLIEWQTNYSFFKGRDLVPQRLQRLPDELQYSTGTSEASKFIGKYTYWSPMKIDNLIRGYTGTMGMFLWQTPDWFAAEKQGLPAKELSEMQFIRDFNVTDVVRNRFVNDFYELQEKANQQQAGYGVKGKPSGAIKAIRKAGKIINDLNKDIRAIETSDKYSPERKRELIDKKRERINATAKIVVKKYGNDFL